MPDSRKNNTATLSGLVRKYLPELEKLRADGESREHCLAWFKKETGREIAGESFFTMVYRARKWAAKNRIKEAQLAMQPVQQVQPISADTSPQKKPKKEKKPEPQASEEELDPLASWKAYEATLENSDPIETIIKLRAEGKIK